jgi:hypothetical protein
VYGRADTEAHYTSPLCGQQGPQILRGAIFGSPASSEPPVNPTCLHRVPWEVPTNESTKTFRCFLFEFPSSQVLSLLSTSKHRRHLASPTRRIKARPRTYFTDIDYDCFDSRYQVKQSSCSIVTAEPGHARAPHTAVSELSVTIDLCSPKKSRGDVAGLATRGISDGHCPRQP